jgi:hypothetical protein
MPPEMTFDYFADRLNAEKAVGKKFTLNIAFSDLKQAYSLVIENDVLNQKPKAVENADTTVTLTPHGRSLTGGKIRPFGLIWWSICPSEWLLHAVQFRSASGRRNLFR